MENLVDVLDGVGGGDLVAISFQGARASLFYVRRNQNKKNKAIEGIDERKRKKESDQLEGTAVSREGKKKRKGERLFLFFLSQYRDAFREDPILA